MTSVYFCQSFTSVGRLFVYVCLKTAKLVGWLVLLTDYKTSSTKLLTLNINSGSRQAASNSNVSVACARIFHSSLFTPRWTGGHTVIITQRFSIKEPNIIMSVLSPRSLHSSHRHSLYICLFVCLSVCLRLWLCAGLTSLLLGLQAVNTHCLAAQRFFCTSFCPSFWTAFIDLEPVLN